MNLKTALLLNESYMYKNVCKLYPIDVNYVINYDTIEDFIDEFMPYMITKEVVDAELPEEISIFEFIIYNATMLQYLVNSLCTLCRTDQIKLNKNTLEIVIDNYSESLNKNNFEEFSSIVLEIVLSSKLKKEIIKEPEFKSENGRKRWLELQKSRKLNAQKKLMPKIYDIINTVQFGMNCYIPDNEIKQMTYWKLMKSYSTILNQSGYEDAFRVYLQCGEKSLIKNHWSDLIKL